MLKCGICFGVTGLQVNVRVPSVCCVSRPRLDDGKREREISRKENSAYLLSAAERCLGRHELKLESRRGQYVMRLWVGKLST